MEIDLYIAIAINLCVMKIFSIEIIYDNSDSARELWNAHQSDVCTYNTKNLKTYSVYLHAN